MKYAIKVWFDSTWHYVQEGPVDNMRVWTTTSLEEAKKYRALWIREGHNDKIEVVEYNP